MAGPLRVHVSRVALAGGVVLLGACVLDLDHLSGGTDGAGGTGTASSSSSGGGADGGDAGCPLLDCTCSGGAPVIVAAGSPFADSPRGLTVTADGLFWVDDQGGAVVQAPAGGGAPLKLADAGAPSAIAVSGDTVVWIADSGLFACARPSCGASAHQIAGAAAPGSLRDVAFDGQTVLWSDVGSGVASGKVQSCALSGCSPVDLLDSLYAPAGVELQGGTAFGADQGNGNQNGTVTRSPATSQAPSQIAASLNFPTGVAVDDTYAYWTESAPMGHVYRCAWAGNCTTPEDVAPAAGGLPRPRDLRVGGGRIYWTNDDDGSIRSCPQPGCGSAEPTVHVTGRGSIQRLAVGTSCLFWTESGGGGAVMKVAR